MRKDKMEDEDRIKKTNRILSKTKITQKLICCSETSHLCQKSFNRSVPSYCRLTTRWQQTFSCFKILVTLS